MLRSVSERVQRAAVLAGTAVVGLNVWTGSPLLALWVGSRVENASGVPGPSMVAIFVVVVVMAVTSWVLLRLLYRLQERYSDLLGRPRRRYRSTWLRSMRAERGEWARQHDPDARASGFEVVVIVCVLVAVAAFEVWFFFYSPSPIDQRSGR
ncbi:MAG: hypothetical protein QOJ12_1525 [Thermoleophilales bacterium]|jgi:hypothetical protein|nr:hypothetical protein [Thermoleophilales bacterium]